ncbi:2-oxoglutarate-dependent dioxygenase 19-like [Impatiens glandulifera]|uniref:2-oxoglutarate-dependent dioxygenase 19-like n=1 Tax=Impatiens glandulifera TaxID=253017 RepID=UPI001FB0E4A0|nr:2-oxoglutarate-dependent dioxygenase 19-like [Impatiens glandulifera]
MSKLNDVHNIHVIECVKSLTQSTQLKSIPSHYTFKAISPVPSVETTIPIVDFSSLISTDSHQQSEAIRGLAKACQDWGFFTVINHGIPDSLMSAIIDATTKFFDLTEEEKKEFESENVLNPIRYGTSFNLKVDKVLFWRDYLKVIVHPQFHFPSKPQDFSLLAQEYCKRTREMTRELMRAISISLQLDPNIFDYSLKLEKEMFQIFIGNLYPPCPEPEMAMGLPPHSDHGLLTVLIQNQVAGLQILHDGKWVGVGVSQHPNSFLVNVGDHLEILSNGRYKSIVHRATVNNASTRISIAIAHGPSIDSVVSPIEELVIGDEGSSEYMSMRYGDYIKLQQENKLDLKTCLDRVRVQAFN